MQAIKNIDWVWEKIFFFLFLFCASVFFLNIFFDLNDLLSLLEVVLLTGLLAILVVRYKTVLLYSLALIIPFSFPVSLGQARISFPSELICVFLTAFFIVKLLTGYRFKKEFLSHPLTVLLLLDLGWMFVSSCLSESPMISFKRLIIRFIYYVSFYFFYYELFRQNPRNVSRIFLFHCIGMLLPIAYATLFHASLGFTPSGAQWACVPFYNDHTMYGAALVFFIPFLFMQVLQNANKLMRNSCMILLPIFLCAAYLSFSRAAWLSLIAGAAVWIFYYFRISWKIFFALFVAGAFIIFLKQDLITKEFLSNKEVSRKDAGTHFKSISNVNTDASNKERLNRWKAAWRMFTEKPVFGFGPGTYQFYYGNYQVRADMTSISTFHGNKGHAHSEYLNYLSESGLPGLMIFLGIVGTALYKSVSLLKKNKEKRKMNPVFYVLPALVTFFVHGLFNGFIEFDKIAMPVFTSIAALTFLDLQQKKKQQASV